MSKYPDAYCVKCKTHTPTADKHTVVLSSQARAVTGQCPKCGNDVYKILPRKQGAHAEQPKKQAHGRVLPFSRINTRLPVNHSRKPQVQLPRTIGSSTWMSFAFGAAAGVLLAGALIVFRALG